MKFKLGEQAERKKKRNNLHAGLLVLQKEKKRNFHLKVKKVMCKPPKHILKYTSKKEVILRLCWYIDDMMRGF